VKVQIQCVLTDSFIILVTHLYQPLFLQGDILLFSVNGLCKKKSKALWGGGGGSEWPASILTLTFGTTMTAELSAVRASHTLPQGNAMVLVSVQRLSVDYRMRTEGLGHLKISKDPTGNQTWYLFLLCLNQLHHCLPQ
jgi:hypothetical protein